MKKITIYIVLASLCLTFRLQAQDNKAVDVTLKGIQIGQKVPDIIITNLHNYKDANGKPTTIAKISDFKGKLLILDFWATWCSPCVAMIPKMDSLQKAFGDKVQFLSVTYQTEKEVLPFLEKFEKQRGKHYDLPVVTSSQKLHQLFPHTTLPHYVWIDGNGVVGAVTESNSLKAENIANILEGKENNLRVKLDHPVKYDPAKPLFLDIISNRSSFKQSNFSNYQDGLGTGYNQNIYSPNDNELKWFTMRNLTIPGIYQALYKKEIKETIIEVKDTSKLVFNTTVASEYRDWLRRGNGYCYEIQIRKGDEESAFEYMKNDLNTYFSNYTIDVQKRKVKCLILIRTSKIDKLLTKGGLPAIKLDRFGATVKSCYLRVFISRLQYFQQGNPLPMGDETGYDNMADFEIQANMSNVAEINDALKKYDLKFVEKYADIDMLVISDKKPTSPNTLNSRK